MKHKNKNGKHDQRKDSFEIALRKGSKKRKVSTSDNRWNDDRHLDEYYEYFSNREKKNDF